MHRRARFAASFTDNAKIEFAPDLEHGKPSRAEARGAIRAMIDAASIATFAAHDFCGEWIEIDRDTARATWHAINFFTWPTTSYVATFLDHEDYALTPEGGGYAGCA